MPILTPGHNCWKLAHAQQAGFLIDSATYFAAFVSAVEQAERSIYIAGWDIDSRIDLMRGGGSGAASLTLARLLNDTFEKTPTLSGHILAWDYSMIYLREREWPPVLNFAWKTPQRLAFRFDDYHPFGASQHQKLVVVDDVVAFCGGMDLSNSRWDSSLHRIEDERRRDPEGLSYGPVHDVQMIVSGDAAACLGDLFRERWRWATGKKITPPPVPKKPPWPVDIEPAFQNVSVAVARTFSAYKGRPEVKEVKRLCVDAIKSAERHIYIENQYFTSDVIAEALTESLLKSAGPEIILVLPEHSNGWLEQSTMDAIRTQVIGRLRKADEHQRLGLYYPRLDAGGHSVFVHSKLMCVDDRFVMVGSANLSNRSMGLDSECNLAMEAEDDPNSSRAIAAFRNRLLAEHLGRHEKEVAEAILEKKALMPAIQALSGNARTLARLNRLNDPPIDIPSLVANRELIDPEGPLEIDRTVDGIAAESSSTNRRSPLLKSVFILGVIICLSAAWRWTPLSEWVTLEKLVQWTSIIKNHSLLPLLVLGAYVVGGIFILPITLLVCATAVVFDSPTAILYASSGALLNALTCYAIGTHLGHGALKMLAGKRLKRLSKPIRRHGILAVIVLRNIPIAPFSVVNFIAGASRINVKDFAVGTVIGMAPGIVVITMFTRRVIHAFENPGWLNISLTAVFGVVILGGGWWIQKRLSD